MADDHFNTLINVLRDRDIAFDRNALEAAYNDPESQEVIQEWIKEYLTPETLLTKDEAASYGSPSIHKQIYIYANCLIADIPSWLKAVKQTGSQHKIYRW